MNPDARFKLGDIEVNPLDYSLTTATDKVTLQPKFIDVLAFLAERFPEVVTRQQIIDEVWDGNGYVGEKALTNAIWHLRKAFKQLDPENEYVDTIRKTGYRILVTPQFHHAEEIDIKRPQIHYVFAAFSLVLTVALIAMWLAMKNGITEHVAKMQPELVTKYPGRELFPSVSNSGRYVVYSWRQMDKRIDLFLKDLQQPDLPHRNLTHSLASESRSAWSLDDQYIYYYRKTKDSCEVVKHHLAESVISVIGQCKLNESSDIKVSPDGVYVAYVGIDGKSQNRSIYLYTIATERVKRLPCQLDCSASDVESIAFSPDSKQLAYTRNTVSGHENIYLRDIATGTETMLLKGNSDLRGIAWHPNQDKLVFSAIDHGERVGYVLDVKNKQLQNLNLNGMSYPTFDNNGMMYYHNWNIDTAIMRLELDGDVVSTPFPLLQSEFNFRYPDYSQSAEKIAYVSNESGYDEIWLSSLNGVERKQLTQLKRRVTRPTWSYDGQYIAFSATSKDTNQLYIVNANTLQIKLIETGLNYHSKPSWSRDGEYLYVSNGSDIYKIARESGSQAKLSPGDYAVERSDGSLLVYNGEDDSFSVQSGNGDSELLVKGLNLANVTGWHYSDNHGIYFFKVRGHDYRLSVYDLAAQQVTDLLRVPERSFSRARGISYVPERNWLLFTGYESPQVDIKRVTLDFNNPQSY